jgi:16S rRNA pseudouridine516 synthase
MRLDKYVAHSTNYSRADVKRLIKAGDVRVNQQQVSNPALHINSDSDVVSLLGQTLSLRTLSYYMLHKPKGYVCSSDDAENPIALDLLNIEEKNKLHFAGRLDKDTTGLVLITDDGEWSHKITSPNNECPKHYLVTVAEKLDQNLIEIFNQGIQLKNESKPTKASELIIHDAYTATLIIKEGKYHQVKRMFAAVGNHVIGLHRTQVGRMQLDGSLNEGEYRMLTEDEIASVYE